MDAKKLGQQPINAIGPEGTYGFGNAGLTKREHFAAMAMLGLSANSSPQVSTWDATKTAECAVSFADALLAELAREDV